MARWEVFTKKNDRSPFIHAGSIQAESSEMALQYARDVYGRRVEAHYFWVVLAEQIVCSQVEDIPSFFVSAEDKPHRYPYYYHPPRVVKRRQ